MSIKVVIGNNENGVYGQVYVNDELKENYGLPRTSEARGELMAWHAGAEAMAKALGHRIEFVNQMSSGH